MLTEERQRYILDLLQRQPIVKSQDLIQALGASESTIRRDLAELEAAGQLRRVHGGAERVAASAPEPSVQEKATQALAEKQAIAKAAAGLVTAHSTVFLDAGTTTAQLIPLLAGKDVTVVTTGVDNASALADYHITAIMLGGRIKSATKAAVGAATVIALESMHFDFAFIGANGIHPKYGITTPDEEEAHVKQTALEQARSAYVLADPTKFGQVSFAKIAKLTRVTILTTPLQTLAATYQEFKNIQEVSN
ncbi:DeoR/GlpR family DNA-binding transcription regulator [Lacticaseibacillus mingshuiensis]|uniref:DeoR/GlpR family DNA-binding transcription regulator n=1 Tax=Lacticaseibacillus mingshuiensis TaxID=2799574 RepID=UPI00194F2606|nr:DeoR/GlpR family DNA-binding transcription regulator [Lacticaseibacillus mingshuiensis]